MTRRPRKQGSWNMPTIYRASDYAADGSLLQPGVMATALEIEQFQTGGQYAQTAVPFGGAIGTESAFSFAGWFYPYHAGPSFVFGGDTFHLGYNAAKRPRMYFYGAKYTLVLPGPPPVYGITTEEWDIVGSGKIHLNRWNFLGISYAATDGDPTSTPGTLTMFLNDGKQTLTSTPPAGVPNIPAFGSAEVEYVYVNPGSNGADYADGEAGYAGLVAQAATWNVALTDAQMRALYNSGEFMDWQTLDSGNDLICYNRFQQVYESGGAQYATAAVGSDTYLNALTAANIVPAPK